MIQCIIHMFLLQTKEYLQHMKEDKGVEHVTIPNCVQDNIVNLSKCQQWVNTIIILEQLLQAKQSCYYMDAFVPVIVSLPLKLFWF